MSEDGAPRGATEKAAQRSSQSPARDWRSRNRDSALTYWARDTRLTRTIFRTAAFAEAFTWLGLLIGMFFKHVTETTEIGVQIFGPLHGAMFVVFCVVMLTTKSVFGWNGKVLLLGLLSAVPPFATVLFERWTLGNGLLDDREPVAVRQ